MLSFEDKIFIKNLSECKRFSARRLLKEYPNNNWKRQMLGELLRRLRTKRSPMVMLFCVLFNFLRLCTDTVVVMLQIL